MVHRIILNVLTLARLVQALATRYTAGDYILQKTRRCQITKKVLSEGGNTEASLFKVEVPDNKYLLDEQKPVREQLKGVQRHIVEAMESLENEQPKCFWVESLNLSLMLSINRSRSREGAWRVI